MTTNIKFKVREFEWFEMQTKVRQIIQQVLGPMQKKIIESSSILNKVKINQLSDQDKINQITLMIANDPKVFETGIFKSVDLKFEEQSKHIEELARQIQQSGKYVDEKFKILDIRMQESSQVLKNVASLRERISKEIELQNDNINQLRTNISNMIDNINNDIRESRTNQQKNLQACQKEDFLINEKIKKIDQNIESMQGTIENHRQMHRFKSLKLQECNQALNKHFEHIQELQDSKNLTKKLHEFVKQMDNQLKKFGFKVDNIVPLITQAQISDCLFYVLPQKLKKRIFIHEHKHYIKLNKQVLEKEYQDIKNNFKSIELLQQMQKRNTRQIVQMKRKKLLEMGIDIDHLTYEQRQKHYNELDLDFAADDDDEVKINNKVDQKQIVAVIDKHFNVFVKSVNEKVNIELSDSKKFISGLEDEIRYQMVSFEEKYNKVRKQCQTHHTQQLLENKRVDESTIKIMRIYEEQKDEIISVKQLQRVIYNFCSLVNHLQIQDEIDKQNISLMGVQEKGKSENQGIEKSSVIELEKKCFSCCGFPASTLSAFKMACLTYNPSPIKIDQRQYKREELLQYTTGILHSLKKLLHTETANVNLNESSRNISLDATSKYETNTFSPPKYAKVETEQNQATKKLSSNNKFRTTRKYGSINYSTNISASKSGTRSRFRGINEEMVNVSAAFSQLKKKNLAFLN